jgi:hypothetical protein
MHITVLEKQTLSSITFTVVFHWWFFLPETEQTKIRYEKYLLYILSLLITNFYKSPCTQSPCTQSPCKQSPCTQSPCTQSPCTQSPCTQSPCTQCHKSVQSAYNNSTLKGVKLTFTFTNKALFSLHGFSTEHKILVWQVQTGSCDHSQ